MFSTAKKLLVAAFVGTAIAGTALAQECAKGFTPLLQKVTINGKVLYEADKVTNQKIEVDATKAADIEYTFKNIGEKPTTKAGRVFVHFSKGGKIVLGGDFWPAKKTTTWTKDFVFTQKRKVNFKKIKGQTVKMLVGIYVPAAKGVRLTLKNKGFGKDRRLPVGNINVK